MGETLDLGRRVELVPMDPHCHDISVALYQQRPGGVPAYLVHSYSKLPGVKERLAFVARAMTVLGGMRSLSGEQPLVGFACGAEHLLACRRVFLECCKLAPDQSPEPRPLRIHDKKSDRTVTVDSLGGGRYGLSCPGDDAGDRLASIANGLVKLGEMRADGSAIRFDCGHAHDALVGLLLIRALNVRAVLREAEMTASRGVLAAPSAQR